jgi:hypothetical protein
MDIIPPVIVVHGADRKYCVCEQRIVVNGIPVYQNTGLSFDTVTDALTEAADYRRAEEATFS